MRRTILRSSTVTLTAITLSLGGGVLGASQAGASDAAIVDTLGAATPDTTFSVFGSGGQAIISIRSEISPTGYLIVDYRLIREGSADEPASALRGSEGRRLSS